MNKTRNEITKNVNRGNDIRVWNVKERPQSQDYNNFSQQNSNPDQKTKDFRELKKKSNSTLIITDSTLRSIVSIGKVFGSGIVYCTIVRYETIQNLNKSLYEECMKYGFCFIDNGAISEKDLWKDGIY